MRRKDKKKTLADADTARVLGGTPSGAKYELSNSLAKWVSASC